MKKTICELFAGVGGFRCGFERLKSGWTTTWFSQWEPGSNSQWAHKCYVAHFGNLPDLKGNFTTNQDINTVDKNDIPDHTLLVGGFPCQDYSVAKTLNVSKGIKGKKGVLWWDIRDTIEIKKPAFCLLENVDRLIKSPAKQRGRDFGIMLSCFNQLGYSVEWRVVNAAQYGAAQRRRRVFIFAYRNDLNYAKQMQGLEPNQIIEAKGLMAKAFPILNISNKAETKIGKRLGYISQSFSFNFMNAGYMSNGKIYTAKIVEKEEQPILLRDVLEKNKVDKHYFLSKEKRTAIEKLKKGKRLVRTSSTGHQYVYSEGPVAMPDYLDRPGRTMLTSESAVNRSTHVVKDLNNGRLRILTPIEAERLQGFDDNWTNTGMTEKMRYFCMGNALVIPMITRMGKVLDKIIDEEK